MFSHIRLSSVRWLTWFSWVVLTTLLPRAGAQDFRIDQVTLDSQGRPQVRVAGDVDSYFVLVRGSALASISSAVDVRLNGGAETTLRDPNVSSVQQAAFYRVKKVLLTGPEDSDGDGIDDVYELRRPVFLNPLDPADANEDYDGDGQSNRAEYQAGTDPAGGVAPVTFMSSPAPGDDEVSVNRETILHFTRPLAVGTLIKPDDFYAEFGGRRILSRSELSLDRRTATLFYLEPLPGDALVQVTVKGDSLLDETAIPVDADNNGQSGGTGTFVFTTFSLTPVSETGVVGQVFASELGLENGQPINRPLAGVIIEVVGREESMRTTTGVDGKFHLTPVPAGRFFVNIDGRPAVGSAWPNGDYFPFVGKAWAAEPGKSNNLAGGNGLIYLPLVKGGTLKEVSLTETTPVEFPSSVLAENPELAGTEILVPPNALFSNNGNRGGRVGIAPVPPDRLPEPLPLGIEMPMVITVQTDGPSNFDRPVPVRFPNLPDPTTGKAVPPGGKTALISFDHDLGFWVVQGAMTATPDGKFLETDAGVGIRQPGWHGVDPVTRRRCDPIRGGGGGGSGGGPGGGGGGGGGGGSTGGGFGGGGSGGGGGFGGGGTGGSGSSGGGGGSGSGGGGGGPTGPCDGGDCGCAAVGEYVDASVVAPEVNVSPSNPLVGTSPNGLFRLVVSPAQFMAGVTYEVFRIGDNSLRLRLDLPQGGFSGFAPDGNGYAIWWLSGTFPNSQLNLMVFDLSDALGSAPAYSYVGPAVPSGWGFSPHGRFFIMARNENGGSTRIQIARVSDGSRRLDTSFVPSVPPGLAGDEIDIAGWGFSPDCDDRSFMWVYAEPNVRATWNLANLDLNSPLVAQRSLTPPGKYAFSRCGDLAGIMQPATGPGFVAELVKTRNGLTESATAVPNLNFNFVTTPDSETAQQGANVIVLAPNKANDNCPPSALADEEVPVEPAPLSLGLHYYAIYDYAFGQITQRGEAGRSGVAHANLFLRPNGLFRSFIIKSSTLEVGFIDFQSGEVGSDGMLQDVVLWGDDSPDTDGDGLHDLGEQIMGTDPKVADSDGDGIRDGAEVQAGQDPLSGLTVRTGVIAAADTPGRAVDVVALNGLAIVANDSDGITVFNISEGLNPSRLAQVDTPGNARSVGSSGALVAVADGSAGLAIIDISTPSSAVIRHQLNLGATANAVAVAGGIGYVGLANGAIVSVELATGTVLERIQAGNQSFQDLTIAGDMLYALALGRLYLLPLDGAELRVGSSVAANGTVGAAQRRLRIFVGGGKAYCSFAQGYSVFDVSNPDSPTLLRQVSTTQIGWKQMVANGSGLGVAAVDRNSTDDGPHDVSLYNLEPDGTNSQFLAVLVTPGLASSLAIYNGLAYVADGEAGLQVVNYLEYDRLGLPPQIALSANFPLSPAQAEEGKSVRVSAEVTDDVQVRSVEFYVNGFLVAVDGNFPFETRFTTPSLSASQTNFRLRAKATDTGGNFTWTDEFVVNLVPDATPPRVTRRFPGAGAIVGAASVVSASFSEPVQPATLTANTFLLVAAGIDQVFGSPDDSPVVGGALEYREDVATVVLNFQDPLPPGLYQARLTPPIADLAGNPLLGDVVWTFWILGEEDTDNDGVPDVVEAALGYDPNNPDTNGNGVLDGDEDQDRDRLRNSWELVFGYDPRKADSDENGTPDDREDGDNDGLENFREAELRLNPRNGDSDGDGWDDFGEVADNTNPLDPASGPRATVNSATVSFLNAAPSLTPSGLPQAVSSSVVSHLNAAPTVRPADLPILSSSPVVSFLNAAPVSLPAGSAVWIGGPVVSFLNAAPAVAEPARTQVSPVVSYHNE